MSESRGLANQMRLLRGLSQSTRGNSTQPWYIALIGECQGAQPIRWGYLEVSANQQEEAIHSHCPHRWVSRGLANQMRLFRGLSQSRSRVPLCTNQGHLCRSAPIRERHLRKFSQIETVTHKSKLIIEYREKKRRQSRRIMHSSKCSNKRKGNFL